MRAFLDVYSHTGRCCSLLFQLPCAILQNFKLCILSSYSFPGVILSPDTDMISLLTSRSECFFFLFEKLVEGNVYSALQISGAPVGYIYQCK